MELFLVKCVSNPKYTAAISIAISHGNGYNMESFLEYFCLTPRASLGDFSTLFLSIYSTFSKGDGQDTPDAKIPGNSLFSSCLQVTKGKTQALLLALNVGLPVLGNTFRFVNFH